MYYGHPISAITLRLDWILPMLMRNVLACWAICGFWDWFLYLSPWQKKLHKFKVLRHIKIQILPIDYNGSLNI